jgi:hypothetical protein
MRSWRRASILLPHHRHRKDKKYEEAFPLERRGRAFVVKRHRQQKRWVGAALSRPQYKITLVITGTLRKWKR